MAAANNHWLQFYQALQQFCQPLATPATTKTLLQQSSNLVAQLLSLMAENPLTIVAQCNLTPRQFTTPPTLLLKALTVAVILSRSMSWLAGREQLFLHAIILQGAFSKDGDNAQQRLLRTTKAVQQLDKQHALLPLLIGGCYANRQPAWQLHPDGPLLALTNQLAKMLVGISGKPCSLQQVLEQYRTQQPDAITSNWYQLLQQLADQHALVGRFAKDYSQHYWFICGMVASGALHKQGQPLQVYGRQFDPASKLIAHDIVPLLLTDLKLLPPQYFRQPEWLNLLETVAELFSGPSESTLQDFFGHSQQHQLAALNLSKQVQLLENQPVLRDFLQHAATTISREQRPVNRLRHAISMLGQNALSHWVAQAELHHYCTQLANPHQQWLEQLQLCLQHALRLLCDAAGHTIALAEAGVISRCATLSLWQHPTLAHTPLARQVQGQGVIALLIQQHIWQDELYQKNLHLLLQHCQQPALALAVTHWHSNGQNPSLSLKQPEKLALLLRLSWQLTLSVFCASEPQLPRLNKLLLQAQTNLTLPVQSAEDWQQQLLANSQCYYPLPVM
ncbi:hypothetical protein VT06_03900 [Arsukibacterium sp. MJ3]|uniref:hypothetical protein n=1 Tax=Arsukibacterium sp. MJ3 TaxID=1632859 RepID=UPI0006274108|nr:hypothetical protein [Arsukibacterium sp. MJ3]KKO50134.1 hypothetical protein VT06_03900 [Arsukibacterium sp. MJ3]